MFRPERCSKCENPASGFACTVTGKLLTKTPDGKPATKYYVSAAPERLCSECLAKAIGN